MLAKVDEIISVLEAGKKESKDDWPILVSMGWRTVIDLNVVQRHLKEAEKINLEMQGRMKYLKWRDQKWLSKYLEEYEDGQELFIQFDDEPAEELNDTS